MPPRRPASAAENVPVSLFAIPTHRRLTRWRWSTVLSIHLPPAKVSELSMEQREYVRRVLEAYRSTPGTAGVVRRAGRLFAVRLYECDVSLTTADPCEKKKRGFRLSPAHFAQLADLRTGPNAGSLHCATCRGRSSISLPARSSAWHTHLMM